MEGFKYAPFLWFRTNGKEDNFMQKLSHSTCIYSVSSICIALGGGKKVSSLKMGVSYILLLCMYYDYLTQSTWATWVSGRGEVNVE